MPQKLSAADAIRQFLADWQEDLQTANPREATEIADKAQGMYTALETLDLTSLAERALALVDLADKRMDFLLDLQATKPPVNDP